MRIQRIHIKNYRALDDIVVNFNNQLNIFYGMNGSGKSSIIYSICDMLSLFNHFIIDKKNDISNYKNIVVLTEDRMQDAKKEAKICIEFDNKASILLEKNIDYYQGIQEEIQESSGHFFLRDGSFFTYTNISEPVSYYVFIPGITQPKIQDIEGGPNQIQIKIERLPFFVNSRGIQEYAFFRDQIISLLHLENKKRLQSIEERNVEYVDPTLKLIRDSLKIIIEGFENITVDAKKNPIDRKYYDILMVKKNGRELSVDDQLSAGEACLTMFIAIISIHIMEHQNSQSHIILVDEIDASLHPEWQEKICSIVQSSFKEVQFIFTSHSPFTWASVERECISLLEEKNGRIVQSHVDVAKGEYIKDIISTYFHVDNHDHEIDSLMNSAEDLIDDGKYDEAERIINNIYERYGNIQIIDDLNTKIRILKR